ncbi:hypothetical protein [Fontibacter flavus]|uniref:Uncharacterized protein n=1 Tax=Fontibacter flavus TaxID=654838 RepID=A0ABV6FY19_9BACT
MFGKIFGKKSTEPSGNRTGIYKVVNSELIELKETPGNGSINDIIKSIGYETSQIHTLLLFDSTKFESIGVKVFTKEPVYVLMKSSDLKADYNSIIKELNKVDWNFEYASDAVEYILEEGIAERSLSYEYLSSLMKITQENENVYHAPELGLFFYFEEGYLSNFSSSDWMNTSSKWLYELNRTLFEEIKSEALQYHKNEIEAMEEVNLQCHALRNIPQAIKNEFIPLHVKPNGNINFYNLFTAHYGMGIIEIDEFKLVNKGRYKKVKDNLLEVGGFFYEFDDNGVLFSAN